MQLLNISFAVSIIPNVLMHVNDFQGLYSGSKAMATYIKKLNLTNRVIIGGPYPRGYQFGSLFTWARNMVSRYTKNGDLYSLGQEIQRKY